MFKGGGEISSEGQMFNEQVAEVPAAERTIERVSPIDGTIVSTEVAHDIDRCLHLARRAAAAFPSWSARLAEDRAALLDRIAGIIERRRTFFVEAMIEEIAAPAEWAAHNVAFAAEILRTAGTYANELKRVEEIQERDGIESRAERAPCGVCLGITPWNAPLILGVRALAMPLLCGNTVIIKGNEFAPRTFRLLGDAVREAGVPEDVLHVILTRSEDSEDIVEALIASPVIRRVNFTGSTRVGRRVAQLCANHLKRPLLELGGQAALVVLDDADLEAAADAAVFGAYLNQGQICMSTERLIVMDEVADRLIELIEKRRANLRVGNPAEPGIDIGPVISEAAAERLSGMISDAVTRGARLIGGGYVRNTFVEPALLDAVEPGMRLYREEVFGPILSITRVANEAEALTVANDSEYGLATSVFSQNPARAEALASHIQSGICHINRPTIDDNPHAPFGGVKSSGYGRFGGRWAINEFTELRWRSRPSSLD